MTKEILVTTLKSLIAGAGFKTIKDLSPTSWGVVVPKTVVPKVIPALTAALYEYEPKVISDMELRIGTKSVFAKNENLQRTRQALSMGRANEVALQTAIIEYQLDYGKPLTIEFIGENGLKFTCNNVITVKATGAIEQRQRKKADLHLITPGSTVYPISVKDLTAGYWESADTYWGERAKSFLMWALDKGHTALTPKGDGYSVSPAIAVAATDAEIRDVVFGADILPNGAVLQQQFGAAHFSWDYTRDVLIIRCKSIIRTTGDVTGSHAVYFQIRNEAGRNPKFLYRGLRAMATMKGHLNKGEKVFDSSVRSEIGI